MKKTLLSLLLPLHLIYSFSLFADKTCSSFENESIAAMEEFLSYRTKPELVSKELVGERRNYKKYYYTIKADNQEVEQITKFYYYQTNKGPQAKKPTVLLFSTVGGVTILERYIAFYFAKRGISTVVAELEDIEKVKSLDQVSPYLVGSLFSSMNILDFVADQPHADENRLATVGLSLGGFRALYLSALDLRVKSATLIVSGLSITETIAHSTLNLVDEIRTEQMKELGLQPGVDTEDYEKLLKQQVMFNVEDLLCRRPTDNYLLFQSRRDTIVPYKQQEALYNSLGRPVRTLSRYFGHRGTAISFGMTKLDKTVKFLASHW